MEKKPLISIIMSAYNSESFIGEAIESVLAQSYPNWEIIITDDCSTDKTAEILNSYSKADNRIQVIINTENKGLTYNLHEMCKLAKGEYIARLDADDVCRFDRLQKEVQFLENNKCDIVCSFARGIGDSNKRIKVATDGEDIRAKLLFSNPIVHSSVMFKNEPEFEYDTSFLKAQDYDLWDRLSAKRKKFGVVQEELVFFRFHQSQISNKYKPEQKANSNEIRSRAISRLIRNESVIPLMNWLSTGKINDGIEFHDVVIALKQIEVNNCQIQLYEKSSLHKAVNYERINLLLCDTSKLLNKKAFLAMKIKLFFEAFSYSSLKTVLKWCMSKTGD